MSLAFDTNLADPDLIPNVAGPPHALFAAWRERDPVHWNPPPAAYRSPTPGMSIDKGFWVLTRYQDVFEASRDQDLFSSHVGGPIIWDYAPDLLARQQAGLMGMPVEQHTQIKRLVMTPFSNKAITAFEPEIARVAREIVDDVAAQGQCEFIFDVASRLPVYTFCVLMGIPEADRDKIFRLGNAAADVESEKTREMDPGPQLFAYAWELAEAKRLNPDDSMMSA
ncbi:MAG TPA: hypothetical protein VHY34_08240, partial [Caulobacteraceae bacterium]|nr:hypothetical protein [Caulobacteraceae bacterium]